jgi:hypothetical protein
MGGTELPGVLYKPENFDSTKKISRYLLLLWTSFRRIELMPDSQGFRCTYKHPFICKQWIPGLQPRYPL